MFPLPSHSLDSPNLAQRRHVLSISPKLARELETGKRGRERRDLWGLISAANIPAAFTKRCRDCINVFLPRPAFVRAR